MPLVAWTSDVSPATGDAPLVVTGTLTGVVATIISATWDWGDGTVTTGNPSTHVYSTPGLYTVTWTAETDHGPGSSWVEITVNTPPGPPVPYFTSPATAFTWEPAQFTLNVAIPGATLLWDFGDGNSTASIENPQMTYTRTGDFIVRLTTTDADGVSAYSEATITITTETPPNQDPTANAVSWYGVPEVSGTCTDLWHFDEALTSTTTTPTIDQSNIGTHVLAGWTNTNIGSGYIGNGIHFNRASPDFWQPQNQFKVADYISSLTNLPGQTIQFAMNHLTPAEGVVLELFNLQLGNFGDGSSAIYGGYTNVDTFRVSTNYGILYDFTPAMNTWYDFAFVADYANNYFRMFVDGVLVFSGALSTSFWNPADGPAPLVTPGLGPCVFFSETGFAYDEFKRDRVALPSFMFGSAGSPTAIPVPATIIQTNASMFLPLENVTDDEYSRIRARGVTNAIPQKILDNGGFPNREIYLWPIPSQDNYAVELWLWEPLNIVDLDRQLNLPAGYERYLIYALAMELCDEFGKTPTVEIVESLVEAENNLKSLNQTVFHSTPTQEAMSLTSPPVYNYIDFLSGGWMLPRRK